MAGAQCHDHKYDPLMQRGYTIYTISLQETRGGMRCGMGILPMIHGRDARATFAVHAIGL